MEYNKLTAEYICEDKSGDRLKMALYVYEAMDTVRTYVSKDVFKEIGERVKTAEEFSGDEPEYEPYEGAVYFRTRKLSDFWIFAYLYDKKQGDQRRKDELSFVAGVYADSLGGKQDMIRGRLDEVDLGTWSFRKNNPLDKSYWSYDQYMGYTVEHHEHGISWSYDQFLTRAIRDRERIVGDVAELLMRIYRGVFPLADSQSTPTDESQLDADATPATKSEGARKPLCT